MSREARLEKALQQCTRIIAAALTPDASPPLRDKGAGRVVTVNARSIETLNAKIERAELVTVTDVATGVKASILTAPDGAELRLLGVKRSTGERYVKHVGVWNATINRAS